MYDETVSYYHYFTNLQNSKAISKTEPTSMFYEEMIPYFYRTVYLAYQMLDRGLAYNEAINEKSIRTNGFDKIKNF